MKMKNVVKTSDRVDVVRCRDCKYYEGENALVLFPCKLNGSGCAHKPDWFCADGERKEDEDEQE